MDKNSDTADTRLSALAWGLGRRVNAVLADRLQFLTYKSSTLSHFMPSEQLRPVMAVSESSLTASRPLLGLHLHQVPVDFHEPYIFSGYRSYNMTIRQSLKSGFLERNNEAINVWTHFLPSVYFLWRFWDHLEMDREEKHSSFMMPWRLYLLTLAVYPLLSCLAHALNNISLQARHICFFVDYVGCSWYTVGVAALFQAYSFPERAIGGGADSVFLWIAAFNGLASTWLACWSRLMPAGRGRKMVRILAFGLPYLYDNVPIFVRFLDGTGFGQSEQGRHFIMSFLITILMLFFYSTHFPERWLPGKFDILGHSHQLFHVCSALASSYQMEGAFVDLHSRRSLLDNPAHLASMAWARPLLISVLVLDAAIVYFYTKKILRSPVDCKLVLQSKSD